MQVQTDKINEKILKIFSDNNVSVLDLSRFSDGILSIEINSVDIIKIAELLKNKAELSFEMLIFISGNDLNDCIEIIYSFMSVKNNLKLNIKTKLDRQKPCIESLYSVYNAADWHERETYDLLGVEFINHPNLKRILLPDDWQGHPLRKDYVMQDQRLEWNNR